MFPGQQVHLQWILELVKEVHEQDWSLPKLDFFSLHYWFCKQWRSLALFLPKFPDESGHSRASWGPRHLVYNLEREYDCFKKHSTSFSSIWIINFIFPTGKFLWIFMKLRAKEILFVWCEEGLNPGVSTWTTSCPRGECARLMPLTAISWENFGCHIFGGKAVFLTAIGMLLNTFSIL